MNTEIIIPTFNGARYLPDMLQSLNSQDNHDFRVIISDNGSHDDTIDIVESISGSLNYDIDIVDSSDKPGKAHALNKGIIHSADAKKLLFLDQDDTVNSCYVSEMSSALDDHSFVAACMNANLLNSSIDVLPRYAPRDQKIGQFLIKIAAGGSIGVTRDMVYDLGMFNEEFNYSTNDVEFCVRAHYCGYELSLVKNAILNYRFRETWRDNYIQGVYYGEGNYAIAQIYPEIRGDQEDIIRLAIGAVRMLGRFILVKKERAKSVHNMGKYVGQIKSRINALNNQ